MHHFGHEDRACIRIEVMADPKIPENELDESVADVASSGRRGRNIAEDASAEVAAERDHFDLRAVLALPSGVVGVRRADIEWPLPERYEVSSS